ncbi:hypothetical protein [Burkholderia pseudomallei]|uniref:hypothetical protein n=1 Tax=Burkholderia pseudomallei TaxID=28450 RepID=UPI000F112C07|nr:hypothetical protein [Burkholderia pseudomallei]VBT21512.1 Uncharacterised protein [Burkholderia pseudomallei]
MSCTHGSLSCKLALAGCMAIGMTSATFAQTVTPATGLGQSWPNATDQSRSPHWHVYVFRLNGIEYVQINDLNGIVHAAVGTAGGTSVALPVGTDAPNVHTDAAPTLSATTQTVYRDSTTTITATPQSNGTTVFSVANICQDPYNCGGGGGR